MRVQTKLLILLLACTTLFAVGFIYLYYTEQSRTELLLHNRVLEKNTVFDRMLTLEASSLESFAFEYSCRDDMLRFVTTGDKQWAREHLDVVLPSFNVQAAWIFSPEHALVYAISTLPDDRAGTFPLDQKQLARMLRNRPFCHFFVLTPHGPLEVQTAPIQPWADRERNTPPRGYLFAGRVWNKAYRQALSDLTECAIRVMPLQGETIPQAQYDSLNGIITFYRVVNGWNRRPLLQIAVSSQTPFIKDFNRTSLKQMQLLLVFLALIVAILYGAMLRWVRVPLTIIHRSLRDRNPGLLAGLQTRTTEFGTVAQLIVRFFKQQDDLSREIAERQQAEAERARLISAIEQASETILIIGLDGNIRYANPAIERITGYACAELIGTNNFFYARDASGKQIYEQVWDTITRGNAWSGHIVEKKKDGTPCDFEVAISPIRDHDGTITSFVSIGRDITKELKMEEQLKQAQKMEAIGTLAGGIAHDFNNILAAIIGYTELSYYAADEGSSFPHNLGQTLKAADRARALVQQILAFSRKEHEERIPVQVHLVIKEALKLLRATIPSTIDIREHISEQAGCVMAEPTRMHQLVMNLCTNAYHAMQEQGGVLEVRLVPVELDAEGAGQYPGVSPGAYVQLTVRDTGTGIDPKVIDRIFDPFFTTKEVGKGTGMGLAVVHGIVKSCGGSITVESAPGTGTSFHVLLPRTSTKTVPAATEDNDFPTGTESVLFVDDEDFLVQLGTQMLTSLGYTVVGMNNSMEALHLFQQHPGRFDLIITDQTMPHMTGYELAQKIMALRPDIPVILCTGFSETVSKEKAEACGIKAFIMKPHTRKTIAEIIRKVMDAVKKIRPCRYFLDGP